MRSIALLVLLSALAAPAYADFIPPSLPAGSQYELVFVTSGGTNAESQYVSSYNAFVTSQANTNPNLPQGVTWHAIASVSGDIHGVGIADANQNAPFTPSIPVYNTAGQLVANATTPLYGGTLIHPILYDQFGNSNSTGVWTGSNSDGTTDAPLGGESLYGSPDIGVSAAISGQWLHDSSDGQGSIAEFYALSSPITVVPEPGTLSLLAAAAGLGFFFVQRRRKSA